MITHLYILSPCFQIEEHVMIKMDDLDHSMYIAEFDWTNFNDDTEECCLLQASLACLDNLSLSETEESETPSHEQQEKQQSPDDGAGGSAGEESYMKLNERGEDSVTWVESAGSTLSTKELHEKTAEDISEQTDTECSQVSEELIEEEGDLQTLVDDSRSETDPLGPQTNVNEPFRTDRAAGEGVSSEAPRAEKERWFVTVNDSRARQRAKANAVKKKRRQKKPCKDSYSHGEGKSQVKKIREKCESEGGRGVEGFIQTNHDMAAQRSGRQIREGITDSGEKDNVISHSPTENTTEPTKDIDTEEPGSSASTLHSSFTPKDSSQAESAQPHEVEDIEFFSSHSYDSENYLSAAESLEEAEHLLMENYQPVDLMQLQSASADSTQDTLMCSSDSPAAHAICQRIHIEPALTFPSAGQRANKMPSDDSACDDKHSTALHLLTHTPGHQEHKLNILASGGSSGDQLSHLNPVPSLTVTPHSVADDPEAYAKDTGRAQPVYAISAFWDEMEKLTINDILQLRTGKSTPPWETQETGAASGDDSPVSHSTLIHMAQSNSPDGGLMDMSDAADSDYFTQPDESKPDRSSCEFSISDFEEEHWQFIGTSRNPSPDPHFKNLQRTNDSPFSSQGEEDGESTTSEGRETPVPVEGFEEKPSQDQESDTLTKVAWPSQKSKSMHNVQALLNGDLTSPLSNDISSLLLSSTQSLEEDLVPKVCDSLETLTSVPFLSNTDRVDEHQISFPEVFEYFFTEDKSKMDSRCVALYNPDDISVTPDFAYPLCTFRNEMSFFSLHDSQCSKKEPIPIFSCSPAKLRALTFPTPDYVFLSADYTAEEDMDRLSPFRVVSHAFIQASRHGASAAAAGGPRSWRSFLSMRKIRFHDKGSVWCRRSGAWVFPVQAERTESVDPPVTVLTQEEVSPAPSQLFGELALQQSILGTIQTRSKPELFYTVLHVKVKKKKKELNEFHVSACPCLLQDGRVSSPH